MASMKYDLPLLDYKTRFSLWQVKMRAVLAQTSDLDEALESFGKKKSTEWTAEEKRKDRDEERKETRASQRSRFSLLGDGSGVKRNVSSTTSARLLAKDTRWGWPYRMTAYRMTDANRMSRKVQEQPGRSDGTQEDKITLME
ncbi:hypothetical protein OsJ_12180 [Oryza sativa Japonica Group]|uniref:Pol polyprotein n=2 Tax=Oryza sativa subsp. japonica TaxID=39947 RepID=A3ALL8_ORYSJ|nr:putative pol polyprotein [Oryza sativa Japonica Group]ABF98299.1 hypothetical protein LOC_Os03g48550 [Oryza sativa Japonica Group]EAZ28207.1 hypothetical protein OsJ_12180 [Oryza sativa Japonica Group]